MPYMVKAGRYRHYKGKEYEVIGCARHSETEEEYVVYRALYGDRGLWVRPAALFAQPVTADGRVMPRFELIREGGRLGAAGVGGCDEEGGRPTGKGRVSVRPGRAGENQTKGRVPGQRVGPGRLGDGRVKDRPGRAGDTTPGVGGCNQQEARDEC